MIILGNPEFATGMKLAGIKDSYPIRRREDALDILQKTDKKEFIIANVSIIKMLPELEDFSNVVSLPDDAAEFDSTADLKGIIMSAVGVDLDI